MPILLAPRDVIPDVKDFRSVLIVSCPMCPPMNLAMDTDTPFLQPLSYGLKTPAYEGYIQSIRDSLEQLGIRTDVFTTRLPTPLMCVWTAGQREKLLSHSEGFDAALVMGCSSAVKTAKDALQDTDIQVFPGMRMKGIANAKLKYQPPMTINIEKTKSPNEKDEPAQIQYAKPPCDEACLADLEAAMSSERASS